MINKNKMSDYARSMIFPEPNPQYGLNRRSVFNLIKFFRASSKKYYGLSITSYNERKFSLGGSFSWNKYIRALDDLVAKEIEPFSRGSQTTYTNKINLDTYSYICYNRKCKFMNPRNARIR